MRHLQATIGSSVAGWSLIAVLATASLAVAPGAAGEPPVRDAAFDSMIWLDSNRDGVRDKSEPGVADAQINLLDCDGHFLQATRSDARGRYRFDMAAGCYRVQFGVMDGYRYCPANLGGDAGRDSDADPATGVTRTITVDSGATLRSVDAGVVAVRGSELGDRVWEDANANGIQDVGEVGAAGVLVQLLACDGTPITDRTGAQRRLRTDVDGYFVFENLPASCYRLQVAADDAWRLSPANRGPEALDSDVNPRSGKSGRIRIDRDGARYDMDVGLYRPASVGDWVWFDRNGDGVQNNYESGVAGIGVLLLTADGMPTGHRAKTNARGYFEMTDVTPGDYRLQYIVGPKFRIGKREQGIDVQLDSDANSLGTTRIVQLRSGAARLDLDLGLLGGEPVDIALEKLTNGFDADEPTGPIVEAGGDVLWEYIVSNTGQAELFQVTITDDQGVSVNCDTNFIEGGDAITCTGQTDDAQAGQYMNTATVCGNDGTDEPVEVCASDVSHYFGSLPGIAIDKLTNGEDADTPTGLNILVGEPIVWEYVVTNTGNVELTDILVSDSEGVVVSCPTAALLPGISMTCSGSGTATAGQYMNLGSVSAMPPVGGAVTASDASHYFGISPQVSLQKTTNGEDADMAPGPSIGVGETVTWDYIVSNDGNVTLSNIIVTDDQGVVVTCPPFNLPPGTTLTCIGTGVAQAGPYMNIGTVCASPGDGDEVCATDTSHYTGVSPMIDLEKLTQNVDADVPTGPNVIVGLPIAWDYVVTNNGATPLIDIVVTDDDPTLTIICPDNALEPGASFTCSATGTAAAGQYSNMGSVTASGNGTAVSDSDPSHYFGVFFEIQLEKSTNGIDADVAPGPAIASGDTVTWTYVATNTGNVRLNTILLSDDQGVDVTCPPIEFLEPGASITCTAQGVAQSDQYVNVGNVCGFFEEEEVCDTDPSHYFGANTGLTIEKSTNGMDADTPPGPQIVEGEPVTWSYTVTNNGNLSTTNIVVTDDQGVTVSCPSDTLGPGQTLVCTGDGIAVVGQYMNLGSVSGQPVDGGGDPFGGPVSDSDPSHYFGEEGDCIVTSSTRHSLWFRDFNGDGINDRFLFDPDARLVRNDDGTASITGTARNSLVASEAFLVEISLAGGTSTPPPDSPKNDYGADVSDWFYYPIWGGTMTGIEDYAGASITISRVGPAFQIGTGANDTAEDVSIYGGSGWQSFSLLQQSDRCVDVGQNCISDSGHGEIMVRIECPEDTGRVCAADETRAYALHLPGLTGDALASRYDLDSGAQMVVMGNGSAYLTGMAHKQGESNYSFAVDLQFDGRTAVAPAGSPHNPHNADTADWEYYLRWSGTLSGEGWNAGAQIMLGHIGPAFQVGTGAGAVAGEEDLVGGSARLEWSTASQPEDCSRFGDCMAPKGEGNISLRLTCLP